MAVTYLAETNDGGLVFLGNAAEVELTKDTLTASLIGSLHDDPAPAYQQGIIDFERTWRLRPGYAAVTARSVRNILSAIQYEEDYTTRLLERTAEQAFLGAITVRQYREQQRIIGEGAAIQILNKNGLHSEIEYIEETDELVIEPHIVGLSDLSAYDLKPKQEAIIRQLGATHHAWQAELVPTPPGDADREGPLRLQSPHFHLQVGTNINGTFQPFVTLLNRNYPPAPDHLS